MSHRFGPRTRLTGSVADALIANWMQGGILQSIQAGTVALASATGTGTATITSVDTTRTILLHLGTTYNIAGPTLTGPSVRIALTNATTVTGTDVVTADGATAVTAFVALQFKQGVLRSVQRNTVTAAEVTKTITAVNTAKALVNLLGYSTTSNSDTTRPSLVLTNATTVTLTDGGAGGSTASFEVWEWN